jgi:hypothetical protein
MCRPRPAACVRSPHWRTPTPRSFGAGALLPAPLHSPICWPSRSCTALACRSNSRRRWPLPLRCWLRSACCEGSAARTAGRRCASSSRLPIRCAPACSRCWRRSGSPLVAIVPAALAGALTLLLGGTAIGCEDAPAGFCRCRAAGGGLPAGAAPGLPRADRAGAAGGVLLELFAASRHRLPRSSAAGRVADRGHLCPRRGRVFRAPAGGALPGR